MKLYGKNRKSSPSSSVSAPSIVRSMCVAMPIARIFPASLARQLCFHFADERTPGSDIGTLITIEIAIQRRQARKRTLQRLSEMTGHVHAQHWEVEVGSNGCGGGKRSTGC